MSPVGTPGTTSAALLGALCVHVPCDWKEKAILFLFGDMYGGKCIFIEAKDGLQQVILFSVVFTIFTIITFCSYERSVMKF